MKRYYETVDVVELPPLDTSEPDWAILEWSDTVFVYTKDGDKKAAFYAYREKAWYSNGKILDHVISWLRPVSLSDLIREVAGKDFDAGQTFGMDLSESIYWAENPTAPNKEQYLNSLK